MEQLLTVRAALAPPPRAARGAPARGGPALSAPARRAGALQLPGADIDAREARARCRHPNSGALLGTGPGRPGRARAALGRRAYPTLLRAQGEQVPAGGARADGLPAAECALLCAHSHPWTGVLARQLMFTQISSLPADLAGRRAHGIRARTHYSCALGAKRERAPGPRLRPRLGTTGMTPAARAQARRRRLAAARAARRSRCWSWARRASSTAPAARPPRPRPTASARWRQAPRPSCCAQRATLRPPRLTGRCAGALTLSSRGRQG